MPYHYALLHVHHVCYFKMSFAHSHSISSPNQSICLISNIFRCIFCCCCCQTHLFIECTLHIAQPQNILQLFEQHNKNAWVNAVNVAMFEWLLHAMMATIRGFCCCSWYCLFISTFIWVLVQCVYLVVVKSHQHTHTRKLTHHFNVMWKRAWKFGVPFLCMYQSNDEICLQCWKCRKAIINAQYTDIRHP